MDHVIPKCTAAPTIIRRDSRRRFVVIDHEVLDDQNLSARALGFLAYLLGKPDNWEVRPAELATRFQCGPKYVYAALTELRLAGYAERRQIRENGRIARWELVVFETAQHREECPDQETGVDPLFLQVASQDVADRPQLKNKEAPRNEKPLGSTAASPPPPQRKRSKLPETWKPRPADLAFAAREFPDVDVAGQVELFRDHWRGNGEVRDDWDATFRNWIRRAPAFARAGMLVPAHTNGNGHPEPTVNRSRGWDRSRESYEQYQARTHADG